MNWSDDRPTTRKDCWVKPRPCPWVSCRHHLALTVTRRGSIQIPGALEQGVYGEKSLRPRMRTSVRSRSVGPRRSDEDPTGVLDEILERTTADEATTCSLDVADDGPKTLEEIGIILGITRERVRQIEQRALLKLYEAGKAEGLYGK